MYDSLIQDNTLNTTAPLLQHDYYSNHHYQQQRKEHVRLEETKNCLKTNLINKNNTNKNLLTLTGRQLHPNCSHNAKTIDTIKQTNLVSYIVTCFFLYLIKRTYCKAISFMMKITFSAKTLDSSYIFKENCFYPKN